MAIMMCALAITMSDLVVILCDVVIIITVMIVIINDMVIIVYDLVIIEPEVVRLPGWLKTPTKLPFGRHEFSLGRHELFMPTKFGRYGIFMC